MVTSLRKHALWILIALAAATAVVVASIPPDKTLGELVRLVLFHGASTWVNILAFTLAALVALLFLVTRREGLYPWAAALRRVSAVMWVLNAGLGLLSAKLNWNTFALGEPRMRMTILLLIAALALLALELVTGNRRVLAAGDVALGTALWALVLTTPRVIHPDSPVLNSGWQIKALFFGQVGLVLAATTLLVLLVGSAIVGNDTARAAGAAAPDSARIEGA